MSTTDPNCQRLDKHRNHLQKLRFTVIKSAENFASSKYKYSGVIRGSWNSFTRFFHQRKAENKLPSSIYSKKGLLMRHIPFTLCVWIASSRCQTIHHPTPWVSFITSSAGASIADVNDEICTLLMSSWMKHACYIDRMAFVCSVHNIPQH